MKLLVLPPHRDVTLVPEAPQGWHVVDVARDFCRRVASPAMMAAAAGTRATAPATAQAMRELLLLRAAQRLSTREDPHGHRGLRALGAVLTALSGAPNGVHLRLDDLELEGGTTERSADVLRAVGQPAPYEEDLARAAERFADAERVRLWLDRDPQLPAAAWLARVCPPDVALEVAGPFALTHRKVVARLPMFQRAVFVEDSAPLRWRLAPLTGGPGPAPLVWLPEALDAWVRTPEQVRAFTGGAPWGGHVGLESLAHAAALVESGCRVAVVGFCAVGEDGVLAPSGHESRRAELARGAERLPADAARAPEPRPRRRRVPPGAHGAIAHGCATAGADGPRGQPAHPPGRRLRAGAPARLARRGGEALVVRGEPAHGHGAGNGRAPGAEAVRPGPAHAAGRGAGGRPRGAAAEAGGHAGGEVRPDEGERMSETWTLGELFVLRHAGFPFDWLESLGLSAELLAETSALLADEEALLAEVRAHGGDTDVRALQDALALGRAPVLKARQGPPVRDALARHRARRELLQARYAEERTTLRRHLRERAADPAIQEAVFLSSPAMFDNVWVRYVRSGERPDTSDARRVERQVYTYLQRFCAKNETTSFFGPIAYGERTADDGYDVRTVPGGNTRRRTFFSFWAVTELARAVWRERTLRPHLPLRLNPLFTVTPGRATCAALKLDVPLSAQAEQLLSVLRDAPTPAGAARVLGVPTEDVERRALPLVKSALLLWGLPFRANDFGTFESVRDSVADLPESDARTRWLERLDTLARLRTDFETADLHGRRELLPRLEASFTEATGKPARRGEGQVYADRLILYEEAGSPFRLCFGARFTQSLESALTGALELSAAYGDTVQRGFREQVRDALGPDETPVDLLDYAVRLRPDTVSGSRFSPVPPVLLEDDGARARTLPVDLLGTSAPGGRYALPDVCLAAKPDGGGFEVMLARVHHHLLLWSWLGAFQPERERYASVASRWLDADPAARGLVGLSIRRRNKGFYVFPGRRLVYSVSDVLDVEDGALTPGDVKVRPTPQGPVLVDGKGERLSLYLPLDDFSSYPPFAALAHPQVLHAPLRTRGRHLPRLSVGGAVYQRERWELSAESLSRPAGFELFLAVQRERRGGGWPRFVFMRSSKERKPYLIDTASPFALELLSHLAREAERLSVEEMYPAPEQLWLKDTRGRYTCELRMQFTRWTENPGGFL